MNSVPDNKPTEMHEPPTEAVVGLNVGDNDETWLQCLNLNKYQKPACPPFEARTQPC